MAKPKRRPQAANPTANVRRYNPALGPGSMGQRFATQQQAAKVAPRPVGAPATATTPPAPPAPSAAGPVQDPAFLAWQAQRQNEIGQTKAGYDAADRSEGLARAEAIRRLGTQKPTDVRKTSENFNKAGLFYSGQLGRAQDELQANYLQREGDINSRYDAAAEARRAARQALDQGYPLEVAAQLAASADRRISSDAEAADAGVLAVPATAPAAVSGPHVARVKDPAKVRKPALQHLANPHKKKKK